MRAASDRVSTGALRQSSAGHWLTAVHTAGQPADHPLQAAGSQRHTGSRDCAASVHISSGWVRQPTGRAGAASTGCIDFEGGRPVHRRTGRTPLCKIPSLFTGRAALEPPPRGPRWAVAALRHRVASAPRVQRD